MNKLGNKSEFKWNVVENECSKENLNSLWTTHLYSSVGIVSPSVLAFQRNKVIKLDIISTISN